MPLHLLGKKSWNVYNADNVARVRRDEADARAREEAAEQRMQEADAARRLAILRGEEPPPLPEPELEQDEEAYSRSSAKDRDARDRDVLEGVSGGGRERRKRKRPGEDDTDFEMRVARERAAVGDRVRDELGPRGLGQGQQSGKTSSGGDVSIVDKAGHIDLFGGQQQEVSAGRTSRPEKNAEYEREAAQKRREAEDQYTMRFANAAGRDGGLASGATPWYVKAGDGSKKDEGDDGTGLDDVPSKDVWGNEDPGRRARAAARLDASDPLAMMKSGARKVREVGKERKKEAEERERELKELRREEKRLEKRRRTEGRRGDDDVDDLEGFSLDAPSRSRRDKEGEKTHHSERRHEERSTDGDRERRHRHDRSRHRDHRDEGRDDRGRRDDGRHGHGHRRHRDRYNEP